MKRNNFKLQEKSQTLGPSINDVTAKIDFLNMSPKTSK
jgi:hypothetical protein